MMVSHGLGKRFAMSSSWKVFSTCWIHMGPFIVMVFNFLMLFMMLDSRSGCRNLIHVVIRPWPEIRSK